ncbi:hypothetical protein CQW23_01590 [Capsicum baccatum]|uniref:F-box associated beta-propeller type 3 domain-containing protein n=1 Tax=Capsicum baccatum TaxID=33114 RepID=A0A2G2XP15_CAPBA|nr:hypothetical protein CQW23_01590 [Capsicum baccatum]
MHSEALAKPRNQVPRFSHAKHAPRCRDCGEGGAPQGRDCGNTGAHRLRKRKLHGKERKRSIFGELLGFKVDLRRILEETFPMDLQRIGKPLWLGIDDVTTRTEALSVTRICNIMMMPGESRGICDIIMMPNEIGGICSIMMIPGKSKGICDIVMMPGESGRDFVDIHTCHSMTRAGGTKLLLRGIGVYFTGEEKKDEKNSVSILQIESFNEPYCPNCCVYLNCANHLFCIWRAFSEQPAAIFNPGTREVIVLPKLNDGFSLWYCSLGFEPEEKAYKVLLKAYHEKERYTKHWILTLGIDDSWREIKHPPYTCTFVKPGVCINGVIYTFALHNGLAIAAFDVKTENCILITLWNNASHLRRHYELIDVKGKLAVMETRPQGYIHMGVLGQTQKEEWESHSIHFPSMWKDIQPEVISCTSRDGVILFTVNLKSGTLCLYQDVTRQSWRQLEIKGLPKGRCIRNIYSYVERLHI